MAATKLNTIKFSWEYDKMLFVDKARPVRLLQVLRIKLSDLSDYLLDYDTSFYNVITHGEDKYMLKSGNYLMLFFSQQATLFTTLRPDYPMMKYTYYMSKVGEEFMVQIENK